MKHVLFFVLLIFAISACTSNRLPPTEDREERRDYPRDYPANYPSKKDGHKSKERTLPLSALKIPKGHLPPPGTCKIWIPGVPPGHQGGPQSCASALRNAPLGAWVITHDGTRYVMRIFSPRQRSVVEEVRYYLLGE